MATVAFDLIGTGNGGLNSFSVTTSGGNDPADWGAGDWFGVAAYGAWPQSAGVPFALADDSAVGISGGVFAGDTLGIIDSTTAPTDRFFGAVDTVNGDNASGTGTATWVFDIAGFADLELSIDMAAMGDFETSDSYVWSYTIDGGTFQDVFTASVDEDGTQTYTMEGGATPTLDDPMQINGVALSDAFQTFTESLAGAGSTLTLQLVGRSDGGEEAFAAENIVIAGNAIEVIGFEDFDGGALNLASSDITDYPSSTAGTGGDVFGRVDGATTGMPFDVADDSVADVSGGGAFAGDTLGLAGQNTSAFFALNDMDGAGIVGTSRTLSFDFGTTKRIDEISIDMAALGDFEEASSDGFRVDVSLDGGTFETLFDTRVDEEAFKSYRPFDGGFVFSDDDPLELFLGNADTGTSLGFLDKSDPVTGAFDTFTSTLLQDRIGQTLDIRVSYEGTPSGGEPMGLDNFTITGSDAVATGTTLSIGDVSQAEGDSGSTDFVFTVTRSGDTSGATEVDFAVTATEADAADFVGPLPSGTVSFAADETTQNITVSVSGDTDVEPDEAFTVTLSNATGGATITDDVAEGIIENDDFPDLAIYEIQGAVTLASGQDSPFSGEVVRTSGIVTAIDSDGYYLQDPDGDGDDATSDAIFVVGSTDGLAIGDAVRVLGTVAERDPAGGGADLDITTITFAETEVLSSGNALPAAVILGQGGRAIPTSTLEDAADFFESLESMRVTAEDLITVAGTSRFGEIFTVTDQGADATGVSERGTLNIDGDTAPGDGVVDGDFNPEKLQIDTDFNVSGFENPVVNTGALLGDVTGVIGYDFGSFQLIPTEDFTGNVIDNTDLAPEQTDVAGSADDLTVASYNVLNLDPNDSDGDADLADGRFEAIAAQIVNNLNTPDVIALQEVQDSSGSANDGVTAADATLQALVDAIEAAGGPSYSFIDNTFISDGASGGQPGGNIRTAYLYNEERVDLLQGSVGTIDETGALTTDGDVQLRPNSPYEGARLPLVATFAFNGEEVTLVNNHFSSKGGSAPILGLEQPFEDRQEDVAVNGSLDERQAQSEAVQTFVTTELGADRDASIVVLGDLNEFEFVSPVRDLESDAGLVNLTNTLPDNERYSFIFQGNSQALDHILVTDTLAETAQFDVVHVNVEFAETDGRASDHDPVVASLFLPAPVETETVALSIDRKFFFLNKATVTVEDEVVESQFARPFERRVEFDEAGFELSADASFGFVTANKGAYGISSRGDRFFERREVNDEEVLVVTLQDGEGTAFSFDFKESSGLVAIEALLDGERIDLGAQEFSFDADGLAVSLEEGTFDELRLSSLDDGVRVTDLSFERVVTDDEDAPSQSAPVPTDSDYLF
ncbi:MAG: endonuclease/exonuclease/phosphatase family protein [Pseudomonadota bacterium]